VTSRVHEHLRSNVVGYIALFVALSGVAWAGTALGPNSVGSPQLKPLAVKNSDLGNGAVTNAKLSPHAVTGGKVAIGSLTTAALANGAVTPAKLSVGATFQSAGLSDTPFGSCASTVGAKWFNLSANVNNRAEYYRDPLGIVHLRGAVIRCNSAGTTIFTLPAGFRPGSLEHQTAAGNGTYAQDEVQVQPDGAVTAPSTPGDNSYVSLDGVTFRCAPSGQNGCP
jgi:hypothetical protein